MAHADFSRIHWTADGFEIGPWIFQRNLEIESPMPSGKDPWFWFFKRRSMVEDYADLFAKRPAFSIDRALELGIWDGGSAAFWTLISDPARFAAVDFSLRGDSAYFRSFAQHRPELRTDWATDQADESAILRLVNDHSLTPLDLVIDDASHLYETTRRSFEILFPRVRPGGLYIIEDWQWSFELGNQHGNSTLATKRALVDVVHDLLAVMGSTPELITKIDIYPLFVAIERGPFAATETLQLDSLIRGRERPTLHRRWRQVLHAIRVARWRLAGALRRA